MSEVFTRSFELGGFERASDGDGRTVVGRIVPFDEPALIREIDDTGKLVEYRESFPTVSLDKMLMGAHKRGGDFRFVQFKLDHRDAFDHRIGYATGIDKLDDGAWATFRLYASKDLDKVQSMLDESHRGLSVEFVATRSRKRDDGVIERLGVHVAAVAATPSPAYKGALITSIREDDVRGIADDGFTGGTPYLDELRQYMASRQR